MKVATDFIVSIATGLPYLSQNSKIIPEKAQWAKTSSKESLYKRAENTVSTLPNLYNSTLWWEYCNLPSPLGKEMFLILVKGNLCQNR